MLKVIQLEMFPLEKTEGLLKMKKLKSQSLDELASDWGIDIQIFKIKTYLIDIIRNHCTKNQISQKKLASMVPGLTQDRVSKILSGQVGHMTIDKLIEITSALEFEITIKAKAS